MQNKGAQVQGMSYVKGEERSRRRKSGMCGNTTKGTAKGVEEKSGIHLIVKSIGVLQKRHP